MLTFKRLIDNHIGAFSNKNRFKGVQCDYPGSSDMQASDSVYFYSSYFMVLNNISMKNLSLLFLNFSMWDSICIGAFELTYYCFDIWM